MFWFEGQSDGWLVMVCTLGLMGESTKVLTVKIGSMGSASTLGLMEDATRVCGSTVVNTVKESTALARMSHQEQGFGLMANVKNGFAHLYFI